MSLEQLLSFAATLGGALFVVRMMLMVMGVNSDHHIQHVDMQDGHHDGDVTANTFKVMTVQSIMAFMMLGGLTGLAALKNFGASDSAALFVALVGGSLGGLLSSTMMYFLSKLDSVPELLTLPSVGATGTTYTPVPMGGSPGLVTIMHNGRSIEFLAVSDIPLASFIPVKVIKVRESEKVLVVEQLT